MGNQLYFHYKNNYKKNLIKYYYLNNIKNKLSK